MKPIDHWRTVARRSHAIWMQAVQLIFGAFSLFDPGAALAVWNLMPGSVASRVPAAFVERVGAVLFIWALITVIARLWRQPKLAAKIQEKQNG